MRIVLIKIHFEYSINKGENDMGTEMTIWNATKDVSNALTAVINTYKSFGMVRKQEMASLDIKIKSFQAKTYAREVGDVIRLNIQEIADTQRYIEQQNCTGLALDMAIEQLVELNILLRNNLYSIRK